jgi:hypothetical protein
MEIPTDEDWPRPDPDYLDEAWAYKNFHGKSFEEAVRLFEDNSLHYQEDLMYMPVKVFGYYLKAYIAYLTSDAARGDSDGASCFVRLIRFKAEHDREAIAQFWPIIEPALKHLVEHQEDYEADWEIYGCFRSLAREIVQFGFETTFDTATPEIVPDNVSLRQMAYTNRNVTLAVAIQVFRNSGINEIDINSCREDILRVFGPPDDTGGGDHPEFGLIPEWIRYRQPLCTLRFEFDGDSISSVTFMPPMGSSGVPPEVEKFLSPETLERLAFLLAPLPSPPKARPD